MGKFVLFAFVLSLSTANAQDPNGRQSSSGSVILSIAVAGDYQFSHADSLDYAEDPNDCPPTRVLITIAHPDTVILHLVDSLGNSVAVSRPRFLKPGYYQVNFRDNHLSTGTYFFRFKTSDTTWTKRLIFMMAD